MKSAMVAAMSRKGSGDITATCTYREVSHLRSAMGKAGVEHTDEHS